MKKSKFELWWKFLGWHCFSFGVHIDLTGPHIEVHLPGGFGRIGWSSKHQTKVNYQWSDGLYELF